MDKENKYANHWRNAYGQKSMEIMYKEIRMKVIFKSDNTQSFLNVTG